jgi:8-amino-7-oxononanoate synthase
MVTLQQKPGRTTIIQGEEYLFFSGYSYLGLGANEEFLQLVKDGIDQYGVVYPSSRISNTPLTIYTLFEEGLATLTSTAAAAVFSSGFLSARTAVEVVAQEMNVYYRSPTHPASACYHHAIAIHQNQSWEHFLAEREAAGEFTFAYAADSINPTPGIINDFSFLYNLPAKFTVTLIVDDSHGIGWMGDQGQGIVSKLQLPKNIDLLLNFSLSKAFHINAGAICGAAKWIALVKQHINFTTSTPPMPALAHAWLGARAIFEQQRDLLHQNIQYLQKLLAGFTFASNGGTPVFVINKQPVAQYLLQHKVIISSFGYPKPEDPAINRIVINSLHQTKDIEQLADLIVKL